MGLEIERKFLVKSNEWRANIVSRVKIAQGYISTVPNFTTRVRTVDDSFGYITIKGKSEGASRSEFEYEIPINDAIQILNLVPAKLVKNRYIVMENDNRWEVDVFSHIHEGLVLAELELDSEDQIFVVPNWIGREVTEDHNYSNSMLSLGKNY